MNTNAQTGSATIYQFPARGRYASAARDDAKSVAALPAVSYGSWYHDDAIEAERAPKN